MEKRGWLAGPPPFSLMSRLIVSSRALIYREKRETIRECARENEPPPEAR